MKIKEIIMETKYTAYKVDDASRTSLLAKFPPKYPKVIAHHVTVEYPAPENAAVPPAAKVKVIGYVDSEDGLEALIVSVNGSSQRPDGKAFHITLSLDPTKYSAKDSNELIAKKKFTLVRGIPVGTQPDIL
jgi:hypothetical protein